MSEIVMPRLSDSMEEGTILTWMKSVGDEIAVGDEIVEIETDKANMAYEADVAGTLTEILAQEGETLPIGSPIAVVGDPSEGQSGQPAGPVGAGDPPAPVAKASSPAASPAPPPAAETTPTDGVSIESPSVGLFWRAPSPGAPPFVELGQKVAAGDTVAIVEVMKLMNHVASPVDGVVTAILVENGGAVEYGQTIVVVDPEG